MTPAFDFKGSKARAIPTVATQVAKKLKAPAAAAAKQTTAVIDTLYTEAFLDPGNWTNGSYDSALEVFDAGAAGRAKVDLASLTAGASAGDTYDDIQPGRGLISSQVLIDAKGQAISVVAKVTFTAKGTNKDGTITLFVSESQYFLRRVGSGWRVVAYDVRRDDKVKQPPASPTTSSAGGSGSLAPTGSTS